MHDSVPPALLCPRHFSRSGLVCLQERRVALALRGPGRGIALLQPCPRTGPALSLRWGQACVHESLGARVGGAVTAAHSPGTLWKMQRRGRGTPEVWPLTHVGMRSSGCPPHLRLGCRRPLKRPARTLRCRLMKGPLKKFSGRYPVMYNAGWGSTLRTVSHPLSEPHNPPHTEHGLRVDHSFKGVSLRSASEPHLSGG